MVHKVSDIPRSDCIVPSTAESKMDEFWRKEGDNVTRV
jgi:hypothetical protein